MIAGLLVTGTCDAGYDSYQCVITEELHLEDNGALQRYPHPINLGDRFAIDRKSGTTIGGPFLNGMATRSVVVDPGSTASAFKTVHTTLKDVEMIQVEEFARGEEKPFVAITLLTVFSGQCK